MTMLNHILRDGGNGTEIHIETASGKMLFESDLQQCVHCQYTWKYKPGSGILRGFCQKCNGVTCGRTACDTCYPKEQWVEDLEAVERRNRASIEAAVRLQQYRERLFNKGA